MSLVTWVCQTDDNQNLAEIDALRGPYAALLAKGSESEACRAMGSLLEQYVFLPANEWQGSSLAPHVAPAPWVVAAVVAGSTDPSSSMRSPEYPMRRLAQLMLAEVDKFARPVEDDETAFVSKEAFARSLVVGLAINAFGHENDVIKAVGLAPRLRDSLEGQSLGNKRVQETLLNAEFLPRRQPTIDHVEIRSMEEFEALLNALLQSKSFAEKRDRMSLCINLSIFCSAGESSARPVVLNAVNYWHLWRNHVDSFATSVRDAALRAHSDANGVLQMGHGFNPLGAPHFLVAGHLTTTNAESRIATRQFVSRFATVLKDIRGRLAPPPQRLHARRSNHGNVPRAQDLHGSNSALLQAEEPSELSQLQAEKLRILQSIADANDQLFRLSTTMETVQRLEFAQIEATNIEAEHDQAESTFNVLADRVEFEKKERSRIEAQLAAEHQRLEKLESSTRHAETELEKARASVKHVEDLKLGIKEQLSAAEVRLTKAQEAADRARDAAEKVSRRAQTRHEDELNRLMEARTSAIEEANATIVRQQQQSEAAARAHDDTTAKAERTLRERIASAINTRREYSTQLTEIQSRLASKLESTRADERRGMLASAQFDQIRRRHGDKANTEAVRDLQLTEATLSSELEKLKQQKAMLEHQAQPARLSAQEAEAAAMTAESEWLAAEAAFFYQREEAWKADIFEILETERHRRNELESQWRGSSTELLIAERLDWDRAVEATQVVLHDEGHTDARLAVNEATSRVNMMNERILSHRSKLESIEYRIDKAAKEHSLIAAEYHKHHDAILAEERSLEAARETAFETQATMKQLDADAGTFREKCDLIRQALSRAPIDPLASVRPVILPPIGEMARRLRRLLRDAVQRTHDANAEALHLERTLRRVGRECDERNEIRSRVRHAVAQYEDRVENLEAQKLKTQQGIQSRQLRDQALREQLQSEYEAAQELTHRHKFEGQQRLREAYSAVDELTALVQKSTSEVQGLKNQLAMEIKRNTPSNEELLRMELFHEFERHKELEHLLLAAQATQAATAFEVPARVPTATSAPSTPISFARPGVGGNVTPLASTVHRSPSVASLASQHGVVDAASVTAEGNRPPPQDAAS